MPTNTIAPPTAKAPAKKLPLEPVIRTDDDADLAMRELAWIENRRAEIETAVKQQVDLVKNEAQKMMAITVDGERVPFVARIGALVMALEEWARDRRDEILAESKKKSREFTYATLQYRQPPVKLEYCEDYDGAAVMALVDEASGDEGGLMEWLTRRLTRLKLTEKLTAADVLRVEIRLDKSGLLALYKDGSLTDEDLAEVGLCVETPEEKVTVKAKPVLVQSESE